MQILNVNHYQRGYQDGLADATEGKNKSYRTVNDLGWWVRVDKQEFIQKTYGEGYDDGYKDGLRKRNNVFENENSPVSEAPKQETSIEQIIKPTSKMNNENLSYEQQVALLQDLWSFLEGFAGSLDMTLQSYTNKIGELASGGLEIGMLQSLVNDCAEIKEQIDGITIHIRYEDKQTIDKSIGLLQELINNRK
jgi:hypothetical protein